MPTSLLTLTTLSCLSLQKAGEGRKSCSFSQWRAIFLSLSFSFFPEFSTSRTPLSFVSRLARWCRARQGMITLSPSLSFSFYPYIHTYIHTHTHTPSLPLPPSLSLSFSLSLSLSLSLSRLIVRSLSLIWEKQHSDNVVHERAQGKEKSNETRNATPVPRGGLKSLRAPVRFL